MEHFINTVIQENERYQVAWPWRNEEINLPENYELSYAMGDWKHYMNN